MFNTAKNKLFFLWNQEFQRRQDPVAEKRVTVPIAAAIVATPGRNWMVSTTGVLSSTAALEISVGSAHNSMDSYTTSERLTRTAAGMASLQTLFPTVVQDDMVPTFTYPGGRGGSPAALYTALLPFTNFNTTYDVLGNVTKAVGAHTLKGGLYFQRNQLIETLALHELHRDEVHAAVRVDVVDRDDVRVVQRGGRPGFLREPLPAFGPLRGSGRPWAFRRVGVGQLFGREDLQGDEPVEMEVSCFVDDPHAARADFLDDSIVAEDAVNHGSTYAREIISRKVRMSSREVGGRDAGLDSIATPSPTITTETFTGTLVPGQKVTHPYAVKAAGQVTTTVTALSGAGYITTTATYTVTVSHP